MSWISSPLAGFQVSIIGRIWVSTEAYYNERHSVRPGVTGWAQVQYPYGASVEDAFRKLEYDLFYLKNVSVFFDCAIVFQTVRIVLLGRGGR